MRYQPKEKPKYNICCPLEPKRVNRGVGVGFFGELGLGGGVL